MVGAMRRVAQKFSPSTDLIHDKTGEKSPLSWWRGVGGEVKRYSASARSSKIEYSMLVVLS
jgi:hypothetical protein